MHQPRLTAEETRELCRLCREGMLYEVEHWVQQGRSLVPSPRTKEQPFVVAATRGFHSLVKLLSEQGMAQETANAALAGAAVAGNMEVVQLLLSREADASSVSAYEVLWGPNPEIVYLLCQHGMDIDDGYPLAHALADQSEEALAFFKRFRNRVSGLRFQASMALRHFVIKGYEEEVTRLKRAGASPRKRVPVVVPRWKRDWAKLSALEQAAHTGTFKMLLRLGVRKSDNLQELMEWACSDFDEAKIMHLLKRGAKVNDRKNGGSSVLQRCFRALGSGGYFRTTFHHDRSDSAWHVAMALVDMGARWIPDKSEIRDVRFWLAKAEPSWSVTLARLLIEKRAATPEIVKKLYSTPMIRKHIGSHMDTIHSLLGSAPRSRR